VHAKYAWNLHDASVDYGKAGRNPKIRVADYTTGTKES
jgi:hypothetical protein